MENEDKAKFSLRTR